MLGLPRGQDMRDYLRRVDPVVWEFVIKLGISAALTLTITYYMMGIIDPSIKTRAAAKKSRKEILRRLNRPDIKTSEQEDAIAKDAVNPDDIDVTFEDIGGEQLCNLCPSLTLIISTQPCLLQVYRTLNSDFTSLLFCRSLAQICSAGASSCALPGECCCTDRRALARRCWPKPLQSRPRLCF
mmetsp:Transcript_46652/g.73031  ORF Transcript_46652/g.73031 Transcript_46652/m.73031 type:complete len:183 (-) Transcript_46652:749-1297(-)